MRKLIFGINITLDGCCDHAKGGANADVHDYFTRLFHNADTLVYGRKTYDLMVPYWPNAAKTPTGTPSVDEFARAFDAIEKIIVFSHSLDKAGHDKTRIVNTGLRDEILKLKQEEGKDILTGGVDIPSQLVQLNLIDEYHFLVQPFVVGEGRRLFDFMKLPEQLQLKLADTKVFKSGYVALRYVKS